MKITGKLDTTIAGPGFVLRRGTYSGDIDEHGMIWVDVKITRRLPGPETARTIGVHVSRFAYVEKAETAVVPNPRAAVNEQIKRVQKLARQ